MYQLPTIAIIKGLSLLTLLCLFFALYRCCWAWLTHGISSPFKVDFALIILLYQFFI